MSSRAFTLLDLVFALGVAALLIFFLREGIMQRSPLVAGRRAQAKNDVRQMAVAIAAYQTEYNRLPLTNAGVHNVEGPVLQALTGSNVMALNPRQIVFLEAQPARRGKSGVTNGAFVDPWGSPYKILGDIDGDGVIGDAGSIYVTNRYVKAAAAVWNDPATHRDHPGGMAALRRSVTSW